MARALWFPCRSASHDVARPRTALHEREDEQHAHGEVLERIREAAYDGIDHRHARARGVEAPEHYREGHEQHQDDEPGQAHSEKVLQVPDTHLARLVERGEREGDRAESSHDVDLDGASPAHDERDHVGHDDDEPGHERHHEHRDEGRRIVVGRGDGHRRQIERHAGSEQVHNAVDGELHHLVDGRHQIEAVLYEEEEYREEDEHEHDFLHAGHRGVAVHLLRNLHELHGEHEREHPAADGQDRVLPHAVHEVVHGDGARMPEHLGEAGGEHPSRADGLEHVGLA